MEKHIHILEKLSSNKFPGKISEDSSENFAIFRELYEQNYIAVARVHSNLEGNVYFEPRITLSGREFLAKLKAPANSVPPAINIGAISGSTFQVGNGNSLSVNVSVQELVERVAKTNDPEAKSKLKDLLNNATVAGLIGAGATALLALL
jgi:hypothetical protein